MNLILVGLLALGVLVVSGCGGETGPKTSTITGTVLTRDADPLRDATVTANGRSTKTSTSGAFFLENLKDGDVEVRAEGFVNGTKYVGRTVIFNLENAQQNNVNVMVAPESEVGTVRGTVRDRDGFLLQGASVFAFVGLGSSVRAVSDSNGNFEMKQVPSGDLTLSATGRGYRSDQTFITLGNQQTRTINFTLDDPGLPSLSPPVVSSVSTWVSHPDATRGDGGGALAWAKKHFGGHEANPKSTTRSLRTDMIVETDLEWNSIQFPDLLGFNVYRGFGASGGVSALDLSFDPLANYYVDIGLQPDSTYSYALSTVATLYPDFNNTESTLSPRIVVDTLNLLNINSVSAGPRFSWQGGSGADTYQVFVFDGFPTGGANFVYQTNTTSGLSYVYDGPSLQLGRTYYYIVLGTANGGESRTISQVGTFVP
ncbi:MAG: carboxypeptidase regulatory-like domain-containing protein [Fimbriimonadaceae bacterium]